MQEMSPKFSLALFIYSSDFKHKSYVTRHVPCAQNAGNGFADFNFSDMGGGEGGGGGGGGGGLRRGVQSLVGFQ